MKFKKLASTEFSFIWPCGIQIVERRKIEFCRWKCLFCRSFDSAARGGRNTRLPPSYADGNTNIQEMLSSDSGWR